MPNVIRFGAFEVDLDSGEVRTGGRSRRRLQKQPLEVLIALVERQGELVGREELQRRLWPERVHVDQDLGLNKAVLKLRNTFGDSAEGPRFIETIPRRGYRFLASVERVTPAKELVSAALSKPAVSGEAEGRARAAPLHFAGWLTAVSVVGIAALLAIGLRWSAHTGDAEAGRSVAAAELPDDAGSTTSLAVLPFRSLGADAVPDYFGLGMADTLITKLSNVSSLAVRPTSAIVEYVGDDVDALEAGRRLGVEHVLEGSVQRQDQSLRVSVRLLRVDGAQPLWAELFEEEMSDLFELQDRVSERVVSRLALELPGEQGKRLAKRQTTSLEAWEHYARGRYHFERLGEENLLEAIADFERAVALDPDFALAYAGIALAYSPLVTWGTIPSEEGLEKLEAAALRALELDPNLAETQLAISQVHSLNFDFEGEEEGYRRAIALNPNDAVAYRWYAFQKDFTGRYEESYELARRAQELDPTQPGMYAILALALSRLGRFEEAIEEVEIARRLDPHYMFALATLGSVYMHAGEVEKAVQALRESGSQYSLACALAQGGSIDEARAILEEQRELAATAYVSPYHLAAIHASLGEADEAFALLERAYRERVWEVARMNVDWRLEPLRGDPRFAELAQRIGLPPS